MAPRRPRKKVAFVTVGTTQFDALIKVMTTPAALTTIASHGFTHLLLQIGASPEPATAPASAGTTESKNSSSTISTTTRRRKGSSSSSSSNTNEQDKNHTQTQASGVEVSWYRYKNSLKADMEAADLIISHAGAGSVMEALDLGKPLLVVVNTALMDDHQQELAHAMEEQGYLEATDPGHVLEALGRYDEWQPQLQRRPPPTVGLLPKLMDQEMGFVDVDVGVDAGRRRSGRLLRGAGGGVVE